MYCDQCGKELKSEALFCKYCGAKVVQSPPPLKAESPAFAAAPPVKQEKPPRAPRREVPENAPAPAPPKRLAGLSAALAVVIVLCWCFIAFMDKLEVFFLGEESVTPVSSVAVDPAASSAPETPAPLATPAAATPEPTAAPTPTPTPAPILQSEIDGPGVVLKAALEVGQDSPRPELGARYIPAAEAEAFFAPYYAKAQESESVKFALECEVQGQKMLYGFIYSGEPSRALTRIVALRNEGQTPELAFAQEISGMSCQHGGESGALFLTIFAEHIVVFWHEPTDETPLLRYVSLSSARVEGYLDHTGRSSAFYSDQNCYILRDSKWFWLKQDGKGYVSGESSGFALEWVDPSGYTELYGEDDVTLDFQEFDTDQWYANLWLDGKEIRRKEFVHTGKRTYVWKNKVVVRRGAKIFAISSKEGAFGDLGGESGCFFVRPTEQSPRVAEGYDAGERLALEYHPGFMLLSTAEETNIRLCFDRTPSGDAKYINFEMID